MTDSQMEDNVKRATQLIAAMTYVRDHPHLFPDGYYVWSDEIGATFYGEYAKDHLADTMRQLRRDFQTEATKDYDTNTFSSVIKIPDSYITFKLMTARDNVCRKIETGETETKEVRDYSQAPIVTKEVPIVKWECDPVLLAD